MNRISSKQIDQIIELYQANRSILDTAKAAGISTVKVRKILLTEGLWQSETSIKIGNLLKQGYTSEQIAAVLYMSIKNVQAYMPYERGVYGGEIQSPDSIRANKYRKRIKVAASKQIVKKNHADQAAERMTDVINNTNLEKQQDIKDGSLAVLKLHLELDMDYMDEEQIQILKKYGSMKQKISRDILIPSSMTLHALNYAILRMFGWQNGHLHRFSLPEDVFIGLTDNKFMTWAALAGIYFRYPTEDYNDIYWDDDYTENQSIKTWMRKKYTGPFKYEGLGEHYLDNQMKVERFLSKYKEVTVRKFDLYAKQQPKPYQVKVKEATVDQVMFSFGDFFCHELIERLPVSEIFKVPGMETMDISEIKDYVGKETAKHDFNKMSEQYRMLINGSMKKVTRFLDEYNIPAIPVTNQLSYYYDYGDGWHVSITCQEAYRFDKNQWLTSGGDNAECPAEELNEVIAKLRPICIAKDGIELVDDVGGLGGFCRMLQAIYEFDMDDEELLEHRDGMIDWAAMMGWTGRKISTKRTL